MATAEHQLDFSSLTLEYADVILKIFDTYIKDRYLFSYEMFPITLRSMP